MAALATCTLPSATPGPLGDEALPRPVGRHELLALAWQLAAAEASVAAGESLLRRLPSNPGLAARLLERCGDGSDDTSMEAAVATDAAGAASNSGVSSSSGQACSPAPVGVPFSQPGLPLESAGDRLYIDGLMNLELLDEAVWGEASGSGGSASHIPRQSQQHGSVRGGWRSRNNTSWMLQCGSGHGGEPAGAAGRQPVHRLAVHCVDDETRIVLALVAE